MKRFWLFFFLIMLLLSNVSAKCSEGQIDINKASATDLDKITYIGPATATKIIDMRPFNSVDELMNVSGIGETKLKAIKNENLACVENSEDEEKSSEEIEEIEQTIEPEKILETVENLENEINPREDLTQEIKEPPKMQELQLIKLNSKDIKDDNSIQENKEGNLGVKYAGFGLVVLCILLLILLFLQRKKDKSTQDWLD